jgi:hypothetical protein
MKRNNISDFPASYKRKEMNLNLDRVLKQKLQAIEASKANTEDDSKKNWQRETDLKPDRYSEGTFTYTLEDGKKIVVSESFEELGCRVWDTCTLFGKYFEHQLAEQKLDFRGKRVLELGSGTGVLGMLLLAGNFECKSVTLTEKDNLVKNLQKQIQKNQADLNFRTEFNTAPLDWFKYETSDVLTTAEGGGIDVIIGSDITVFPKTIPYLVGIMKHVAERSEHLEIYIGSVTEREAFRPFLDAAAEAGIAFQEIPKDEWHPNFRSERISLVKYVK